MRSLEQLKRPFRPAAQRLLFNYWLKNRIKAAFICGSQHTGSSLLNRILSHHSEIYAASGETQIFSTIPPKLQELAVLYRFANLRGQRFLVEKTPEHIGHLDRIVATIPSAKFILTMRDGRDVAASKGKRLGGDFTSAAAEWIEIAKIIASRQELEERYLVFRYESFVEAPAERIGDVCRFIGVSFEKAMMDYHETPRSYAGFRGDEQVDAVTDLRSLAKLRAYQINQPIFDGRGRWRNELPDSVVRLLVEGDGAEMMRRFGYI